jgi:hypothetical protein
LVVKVIGRVRELKWVRKKEWEWFVQRERVLELEMALG